MRDNDGIKWKKYVEMIVIDYIQDKVFLYRNLLLENVRFESQITAFLTNHGHGQYSKWMIRPKIEIVEIKHERMEY